MSLRYTLLAAAAAGVMVLGVYLFFEVRAAPAPEAPSLGAPAPAAPPTRSESRSAPTPHPVRPVAHLPDPPAASGSDPPAYTDAQIDVMMKAANHAYDQAEYDDAMDRALKVLAARPGNVRMLRILVSASCIEGDSITAQKYYDPLPRGDKDAMSTRCARYGVTFDEPAR